MSEKKMLIYEAWFAFGWCLIGASIAAIVIYLAGGC